jgi:hypothetical protein
VVEAVLSLRIDDLELGLTKSGYDVRNLVEQFDANPPKSAPCCAAILSPHARAS